MSHLHPIPLNCYLQYVEYGIIGARLCSYPEMSKKGVHLMLAGGLGPISRSFWGQLKTAHARFTVGEAEGLAQLISR